MASTVDDRLPLDADLTEVADTPSVRADLRMLAYWISLGASADWS